MKSGKWLGIPVHALGGLFIARWLAITGLIIAALVGGGFGIAKLGQSFDPTTREGYTFGARSRSETAELKKLNELVIKQKAAIAKLQGDVANEKEMRKRENALWEKQEKKLKKKLEEQASKIGKIESNIETLENEKSKLEAKLDVAEADLEVTKAELKAEQSTRNQTEKELKRALAQIKDAEKEKKAVQSALAVATVRVQKLDDRILEFEAILADPRDGSTAQLHSFIKNYWKDVGSRRLDRVLAAWSKPNEKELRGLINKIEWVKVKKVAAKPPSRDKNGDMTSAAYVCITSKNQGQSEDDWAGTMSLREDRFGWRIERMNLNKGPCY